MLRKLTKRRAVSPVIATVILVAVTITVAVAVSYWMSGISGQYTQFEKVEIQSGFATKTIVTDLGDDGLSWVITIKLKNTGSAPSTIISCFVNEKPIEEYLIGGTGTVSAITWEYVNAAGNPQLMTADGVTLESGTSATLLVTIAKSEAGAAAGDAATLTGITFTSGTTINVKLHSASGMDYIRLIQLG